MMLINDHYLPQNKIKCCLTLPSDVRCALRTTTQCHFSLVKLANDYYCYARSKKRKKYIWNEDTVESNSKNKDDSHLLCK